MRLKYKVLLLAVVPLLMSLTLIAVALQAQQRSLAERRRLQVRTAFMSVKEGELRHYVALALSTISPLYNSGRNDAVIKQQVMQQLANLDYGADGYFFLYDLDGVNLMHPRQPELVGRNLVEMRDAGGEPTIRMLLQRARTGGGFVAYHWRKPSTQLETSKLGYVTVLERWGWMVGTGMYLDDIDEVMRTLDTELERSSRDTLLWIAGAGGLGSKASPPTTATPSGAMSRRRTGICSGHRYRPSSPRNRLRAIRSILGIGIATTPSGYSSARKTKAA